jgi:CMP/dCMP kinase
MAEERTVAPSQHLATEAREEPGVALRVITLDGPSAAGKSTLGAALAKALRWTFVDSGLVYRGLARIAIELKVDVSDIQTLSTLATGLELKVDGGTLKIGDLEPGQLLGRATAEFASSMATEPEIRRVLTTRMQRLIAGHPCVVAGRDAGTAISPEAPLRIFLNASLDVRSRRRAAQSAYGFLETTNSLQRRDQRDKARETFPLQPAPGAVVLDTSHQTLGETLATLRQLASQRNLLSRASRSSKPRRASTAPRPAGCWGWRPG